MAHQPASVDHSLRGVIKQFPKEQTAASHATNFSF